MTEKSKQTEPKSQKTAADARKERLTKALRDNLQRRKQHARSKSTKD
jgi:hypothetical protein